MAAERWDAWRHREWEEELSAAHAMTLAKLPRRTRDILAMPARAQRAIIAERRRVLAAKAKAKRG